MHDKSHISDQDLLLAADDALSKSRIGEIQRHLNDCTICRARMNELEQTMAGFARSYHETFDAHLPTSYVSRGEFRARLSELANEPRRGDWWRIAGRTPFQGRVAYVLCTGALVLIALLLWQSSDPSLALSPNPVLTPGAALPVTQADICSREPVEKSQLVLASIGKQVFAEYGIHDPRPRRYELDYLIDPDLGGSDDTRNLWPQPYSAQWNAHVKDALEQHLRNLVCAGTITLSQAQQDISVDWISAYKKYFETDRPLAGHLAFVKDQPWE